MTRANTPHGKIFWATLIVLSISMTTLSISQAVSNFFGKATHVVAEHKGISDIIYPPLKICFTHWISWVNFTSAQQMNFTKPEVLFALSYLTKIYSDEPFDQDEAEKSFFEKLKVNNMSFIEQFYESIAYRRENVMQNFDDEDIAYDIVIDSFSLDSTRKNYYVICYKFSEENIKRNIQKMVSKKKGRLLSDGISYVLSTHKLSATKSEITQWLTEDEYSSLIKDHSLNVNKGLHGKNDFVPLWAMFNGYTKNGVYILKDDAKYVTLNTVVNSWKNKATIPCREDSDWVEGNATCYDHCSEKFVSKTTTMSEFHRKNYTEKIFSSKNPLYFKMGDGHYGLFEEKRNDTDMIPIVLNSHHESALKGGIEKEYEECIENCNFDIGCDIWTYTLSEVDLFHFANSEKYIINYPASVKVMKEVNLQTWENFVASIGGILGIWSGASILTFLQIAYLFCYQGHVGVAENPRS